MIKTDISLKERLKKFIIITAAGFFCIIIQGILFLLDKSVYFGSFLVLIITLLFIYTGYLDKEVLILNGLFLIACPILLLTGKIDFSNYIALNIVTLSFLFAIIYLFRKKIILNYSGSKKSRSKILLKYSIISLSIIFVVLLVFINKEETDQAILRLSNPGEYYRGIEEIELEGIEYNNEVNIHIDNPKSGDQVSGLFAIEGWAADLSGIDDAEIDRIYLFLNDKPQNNGIFLGRIDTKIRREDIAGKYGEKYKDTGFYVEINSKRFDNGFNKIYIFAESNYFGWKYAEINIDVSN